MGAGLCCAQKGAIDDRVVVAVSRTENGVDDGDRAHCSGAFRYEDEDGADIFFSAVQSLSQIVSELPYPPTATRKSGRSGNVTVDLPESLLQLKNNVNDNNSDALEKIDEMQTSKTNSDSSFLKRPTEILTRRLTEELITIEAGYPGELSKDELEACLEFRRRLKDHSDPTYRAMVYLNVDADMEGGKNGNAYGIEGGDENSGGTQRTSRAATHIARRGPEEEAFALCRFLRARQFDVDKTFAMMDEHIDLFKEALTNHDLYRSKAVVEDHTGCPLPVFTKQMPMLDYGLANNGAFVVYMKAGLIRLQDGLDCINTASSSKAFLERYMPMSWYITCRVFCETMHRLQMEHNSTTNNNNGCADFVVLSEAVVVVDLEGLQRELFTKRTMEFIQQLFMVIRCFPEILNRVVIINVPYFFPFIWAVLKHFIDARTAKKIGFFSNLASAQKELLAMIDPSQRLSDYGGETGNPSYEEALALKLKRDGEYDRYVFERYSKKEKMLLGLNSDTTTGTTLQTFSLNKTEEAELRVYTQAKLDTDDGKSNSNRGTQFLLLPEYSTPIDAANASEDSKNETKRDNSNANKNRKRNSSTRPLSRFGQPAATTPEHCMVVGPGNFRLVVKKSEGGPVIEKALLVVSIR